MDSVGSYEAKTHLSSLLQRVARGERITITRHDTPIAMLVPVEADATADRAQAIEGLKAFRKGRSLGGLRTRDLIDEGRRF